MTMAAFSLCSLLCLAGAALAQPVDKKLPSGVAAQPLQPGSPRSTFVAGVVRSEGETLAELLPLLNATEFQAREAATLKLIDNRQITLAMLEDALLDSSLTLEQRQRVGRAAKDRFDRSPRAAMGVEFGSNLVQRIGIQRAIENFASARLLEEGDLIVEAGGVELKGPGVRGQIRAQILSRNPGDTLKIVVRRGDETLNIDMPLGSFNDLRSSAYSPSDLSRAWTARQSARASQRGVSPQAPIETGHSVQEIDMAAERTRIDREMQRLKSGGTPLATVRGGGQPTTTAVALTTDWQNAGALWPVQNRRLLERQAMINAGMWNQWDWELESVDATKTLDDERRDLDDAFAKLWAEHQQLSSRTIEQDLADTAKRRKREITWQIRMIAKQMAALKAEETEQKQRAQLRAADGTAAADEPVSEPN
jgi:hypothetical protein